MALTQKQEKFCECIVSGMSNIESYMTAYNSESKGSANVESTKLLQRDDILERIEELRKPIVTLVQTQAINARQEQIEFIKNRIQICIAKDDETSVIRYTDMLNKLLALYKETETEQNKENPLETLDNDKLRRLLA